jgi:hypothetical protein
MRFTTALERTGKTTTGLRVPDEVIEALGQGKRPRVVVTLDDRYTFRTTVGPHAGSPVVSVSAAVRDEAGVTGGDILDVELVADTEPREVEVPDDLAERLAADGDARRWFEGLTDSQRRGFVTSITSAKQADTRARRVEKAMAALPAGEKRP